MPDAAFTESLFLTELKRLRALNPLVHCMTNQVVQEITANVLLAAGGSPPKIVGKKPTPDFCRIWSAHQKNRGARTPHQRGDAHRSSI